MTHLPFRIRSSALAISVALTAVVVASCGGVGSGGTGRSDTGQAIGTVSGLGSIIVDGVTYDVRGAEVVSEVAPSVDAPADVNLGDRVSVAYEVQGVARVVRVDPTLSGTVTSISASGFAILGQSITINDGVGPGPLTQFGGGYVQGSDIKSGDSVDVHGVLVLGAPNYTIQATRVDKLAAPAGYLRLTGLVSNVVRGGSVTFNLAELTVDSTSAVVLPGGTTLANGETVVVLAPAATLAVAGSGAPKVLAAQVRVVKLMNGGLDDDVSGSLASLDTQARTFMLGSLTVNYAGATVTPLASMLANRQYVKAHGAIAGDGTMIASSVSIRDGGFANQSSLKGNISGLDATARRLVVRDVVVDFSTATILGCPAGLANGQFVEINGTLSPDGIIAATIQCQVESSGSTVEREGLATGVDVPMQRFTLTTENGSRIVVQWSASTFFGGLTPSTLGGKDVEVEGTLLNGVLTASKIKVDD